MPCRTRARHVFSKIVLAYIFVSPNAGRSSESASDDAETQELPPESTTEINSDSSAEPDRFPTSNRVAFGEDVWQYTAPMDLRPQTVGEESDGEEDDGIHCKFCRSNLQLIEAGHHGMYPKDGCLAVQYAEQSEDIPFTAQEEGHGMFSQKHDEMRYEHYKKFAKGIMKAHGFRDRKKIPKCISRLLRQVYQSFTYTDHKAVEVEVDVN